MVDWENVAIVVGALLPQDVDAHRCHSSRCIDRCRNHVVECSEPNVDVSDDRCGSHSIDEGVAPMVVQRFTLALMFNG